MGGQKGAKRCQTRGLSISTFFFPRDGGEHRSILYIERDTTNEATVRLCYNSISMLIELILFHLFLVGKRKQISPYCGKNNMDS